MKSDKERFIVPNELQVYRMRFREGPPLAYLVHQKNSSRFYPNKAEALKAIKWPKSTPTGEALREWFDGHAEADAELVAKAKASMGRGESPHQDAIALDYEPGTFQLVRNESWGKTEAETKQETAEILPFEVKAEDLDAEAEAEFEANPCENTRMVV